MLDAPLFTGKTWVTATQYYLLPQMAYQGDFEMTLTVVSEEMLTLPAGQFPVFGIGEVGSAQGPLTRDGVEYALSGERLTPGRDASDWYSENVGLVQYRTDDLYQLVRFDAPTPVVGTTWGRVKALFP